MGRFSRGQKLLFSVLIVVLAVDAGIFGYYQLMRVRKAPILVAENNIKIKVADEKALTETLSALNFYANVRPLGGGRANRPKVEKLQIHFTDEPQRYYKKIVQNELYSSVGIKIENGVCHLYLQLSPEATKDLAPADVSKKYDKFLLETIYVLSKGPTTADRAAMMTEASKYAFDFSNSGKIIFQVE